MRDAEDLVDGGHDVVHVVELIAHDAVRPDASRPCHGHRVAGAAEVAGHQLGVVKRGVACPGPTRVVHVVGLRRAQGSESTEPLERGQLLVDRDGNVVLRQQLTDAALLPLGAGSVVAEDVEDDRVLGLGQSVQLVEDPADLNVDVLDEAGEDFHQTSLEGALRFGDVLPALHGVGARREFGVCGVSIRIPSDGRRHVRGTHPSRRRTSPRTCPPTR